MADEKKDAKPTVSKKPAFKARSSRLDSYEIVSESNPYRGFFVAFWIALFLYSLHTIYRSYKTHGTPIGSRFFRFMTQDGWELLLSDITMNIACYMCVILHKLLMRGWIPARIYRAIQHTWQTSFLFGCIYWILYREWFWLQSGFFTLHSISLLMKQHSYLSTNRDFEMMYRQIKSLEAKLKKEDLSADEKTTIEAEIGHLKSEITTGATQYPVNVTTSNFIDYMLVPTLVYDLEYPRTEKFRLTYFLEKVLGIFASLFLLYATMEHYILGVLENIPNMDHLDILMSLLFPFTIIYFMIFNIIFEGICNAFAELTRFADRDFYSDWWNSTSFDEYARKWNRPVHEFLLRHVYYESLSTYKMSKTNATLLTFLLSSCLHELVMAVIGKRVRFYLFFFQMLQLPLIYFGRLPFMRRNKLLGNCIYWFGMLAGPPLITTLYVQEQFANPM